MQDSNVSFGSVISWQLTHRFFCSFMKWRNIFSLYIHNTIHFEGDADQETCAPMVRYLWHPLKDLWRFKYSIFLLALFIKIWISHFCFQGSCKTNDDCVTPGFHICSENCTDRFSSHQKYLRITCLLLILISATKCFSVFYNCNLSVPELGSPCPLSQTTQRAW